MVRFRICVYIDQNKNNKTYTPGVTSPLKCIVRAEEPFDKGSRRFNRYTHEVKYTEQGYIPKDYLLYIYDPKAWYFSYILSYYYPSRKVISVELYFPSNDKSNRNPLVIGFNEEGNHLTYYTYKFLSQKTSGAFNYTPTYRNLPERNRFFAEDLVTRATEELGLHGPSRRNRIVVQLDKRPSEDKSINYPNTGPNKGKVTVSKNLDKNQPQIQSNQLRDYFDTYTHSFARKETYSGFYMSLGIDTLFLDNEGVYKNKYLDIVEVYCAKTNPETFVIVVINFTGVKKWFTYTDFQEYLKKPDATVKVATFKRADGAFNLIEELKKENDKIDDKVVYLIEKKTEYSSKIEIKSDQSDSNGGFTKYTHTRKDEYKGQTSLLLYKGKSLLKKKQDKFVDFNETTGILYDLVEVYFGTKNPDIPLFIKLTKSQVSVSESFKRLEEGGVEYWESQIIREEDDSSELTEILKKEEANLFSSIVLVVDQQKPYTSQDIEKMTGIKLTGKDAKEIKVEKNEKCSKLKEYKFQCYEHDMSSFKPESTSTDEEVKIKLFFSNKREMNLYDDANLTYLNFKNSDETEKLYVYFYEDDIRPYLLCYNNDAFRPFDLSNYSTKWVKIKNISRCPCDGDDDTSILDELNNILLFMNPVKIDENSQKDVRESKYTTHSFSSEKGKTNVEVKLVAEDMNCFRKYTHTSGTSSVILGEIRHDNVKLFNDYADYKSKTLRTNKFPSSILVFYYLYDYFHNWPLMIVLDYAVNADGGSSVNDRVYFGLIDKDTCQWSKLEVSLNLDDKDQLETKLREIKHKLGLPFTKNEDSLIISTSDKCHEGSAAGPVAGTMATLGLAGAGVGLGYYLRPELFAGIYRRLF